MSVHDKLKDLFLLDQQLRGLRGRLDGAVDLQKRQQLLLDRLNTQEAELAQQHREAQVKAASFEHQARDVEARVAKLREQMNSVRSNKEYSALLLEVNTIKIEKSKLEDQALEHMGRVEALAAELATHRAKIVERKKVLAGAGTEVEQARQEIGGQLEELTARRDAAAALLSPDVLAQFNRQAHIHDGQAMAPVIEESRKHFEYSCGGCYMSIPVERVNALIRGDEQVADCTNCGRLLYLDQELRASMTADPKNA